MPHSEDQVNEVPRQPPLLVFPERDDEVGWLKWWDRYRDAGNLAARLDPQGPLYRPEYCGDHRLPEVTR